MCRVAEDKEGPTLTTIYLYRHHNTLLEKGGALGN